MAEGIENVIERLYNNVKDFPKSKKEYRLIDSDDTRENESYFKLGLKLPFLGQRKYVQSKFDEIIQQYHSSGLEEAAKDPDNYVTAKVSNNFWRRRIRIKTPDGELDIRAYRSPWKWLDVFSIFPLLPFIGYRIKARFKRFHKSNKF